MEIKLPVSELKSALPVLSKIVPRNSSLPVLRMLRVTRYESGTIQLQTTDIDTFASFTLEGQPGEPVDLLVAFDALARTAKGCSPTDHLTLIQTDAGVSLRHQIAGRPVERVIETMDINEWPAVPDIREEAVPLDDSVKEGILRAFACCSSETTRAAIMGAWLDASDSTAHYVMGTDGRHLFSANSFRLDLKGPVFIPHHAFLERAEVRNDGPWSLALQPDAREGDAGWLQIRSQRWTFTVKLQDHSMPNWRLVVPETRTTTVVFGDKATALLLDVLPKLPGADEPHHPIRLDIVDKRLLVTAGDKSTPQGTTFPVEDAVVTGDNLTITVDRNFPLKALKWGLTEMALIDALSPLVFSAPGRRLVAMPMRTEGLSPVSVPEPEESTPAPEATPERAAEPVADTPIPIMVEESPEPQPVNRMAALPEPPTASPTPVAKPSIRAVLDQIDIMRDSLRSTVRQFGDVVEALRLIDKERRTTDREVEVVREKLRALQGLSF
jgi:DNA polymerase III sliding clamp (beta) subunit (PCNA family)